MVFVLHSKVVQNIAAVVEFVHSIIKTLNCCVLRLNLFILEISKLKFLAQNRPENYKCPNFAPLYLNEFWM